MSGSKHWVVDVYIEPEDVERITSAYARLSREYPEGHPLDADGCAHRLPGDQPDDAIGAELAAARALSRLAKELEQDAVRLDAAVSAQSRK